jgi:hypothetical protein
VKELTAPAKTLTPPKAGLVLSELAVLAVTTVGWITAIALLADRGITGVCDSVDNLVCTKCAMHRHSGINQICFNFGIGLQLHNSFSDPADTVTAGHIRDVKFHHVTSPLLNSLHRLKLPPMAESSQNFIFKNCLTLPSWQGLALWYQKPL